MASSTIINLALDEQTLSDIDRALKKKKYGTRTEFIHFAIRAKLERIRREESNNSPSSGKGKPVSKGMFGVLKTKEKFKRDERDRF